MDVTRLWLKEFKGVEASIQPRSINVFFGKNGCGKSNTLEAISATLARGGTWRQDPLRDPFDESPISCEAATRVDDSVLQRVLHSRKNDDGRVWFHSPGWIGPPLAFEVGPLPVLLSGLEEGLLDAARRTFTPLWGEIAADYQRLVRRRLSSRWLLSGMEEIWWVPPPQDECDENDARSARHLMDVLGRDGAGETQIPGLGYDFVRGLCDSGPLSVEDPTTTHGCGDEWWLFELDAEEMPLAEVVRISADPMSLERLVDRLQADVLGLVISDPGTENDSNDAWLEMNGQGWTRVNPIVDGVCSELGALATSIAPGFVSGVYDIVARPIPPSDWVRNEGRRLRIELKSDATSEGFDIRMAGSGVALWSGYALEEAMRRLKEAARHPNTPSLPLIMVIDEPERHLHPTAQREVADWLATQLAEGVMTFLATHSVPFLNLPAEDVGYFLVRRDAGVSSVDDITGERREALERNKGSAGVRSVDLIALSRAVLFVEGWHDELVIEDYFGKDLSAAGIEILPIEGHAEIRQLADLRFVSRLQIPMIALLDEISWKFIHDPSLKPSSSEEKAIRILRELRDDITFPGFEEPDIWCAFPDEVVTKALELWHGVEVAERFLGWAGLADQCRDGGKSVKKLLCAQVGLKPPEGQKEYLLYDELLRQILATRTEWFPDSLPKLTLQHAMAAVLAFGTDQPSDSP